MKEIPNFKWKPSSPYNGTEECHINDFILCASDGGIWEFLVKSLNGRLIVVGEGDADDMATAKLAVIDYFSGYFISLFEEVKKQFKISYFG